MAITFDYKVPDTSDVKVSDISFKGHSANSSTRLNFCLQNNWRDSKRHIPRPIYVRTWCRCRCLFRTHRSILLHKEFTRAYIIRILEIQTRTKTCCRQCGLHSPTPTLTAFNEPSSSGA